MSVKNKVKRLNKEIEKLNNKIKELESDKKMLTILRIDRREEEIKAYKDNFIKMILNERKPLEHNCCKFSISIGQLETMKNARLEVEKNREYFDTIDFILKV